MILDTNVLSAYADGVPEAVRKVTGMPSIEIPVIVVGEYRYGIALSRRAVEYRRWLESLLRLATVLPVDDRTTGYYAEIRVELKVAGKPIPANDLWIAALAVQHGLPVLSRDRHFDHVRRIKRINW